MIFTTSISNPDVQLSSTYGSLSLAQKVKVHAGAVSAILDARIEVVVSSLFFNTPVSHSSMRIGFRDPVNENVYGTVQFRSPIKHISRQSWSFLKGSVT